MTALTQLAQNRSALCGALVLGCLLLSSCAYRLGGGDRKLPGGYQTVSVPVFANQTTETGVEVAFTNALIEELERSRLARVEDKRQAELILEGQIDSATVSPIAQIGHDPASFSQQPLPRGTTLTTAYRLVATVSLTARQASTGRSIWSTQMTGERTYFGGAIGSSGLNSANATYNHSRRVRTLEGLAVDMMADAVDRLTEAF